LLVQRRKPSTPYGPRTRDEIQLNHRTRKQQQEDAAETVRRLDTRTRGCSPERADLTPSS
jgi:hypothetical protein